jgi:transcriptional regulator with XRE-family HTH domain
MLIFAHKLQIDEIMATNKSINRLKVVLAEKKRTNKWLAEELGKDQATVSKWCTNAAQPSLEMLLKIAEVLEVDVRELLCATGDDATYIKVPKDFTKR